MSDLEPFTRLRATAVPLPGTNVDTDQIIPASYLKVTDKSGLGEGLFAHWREDPQFVLNQERYRGARILLAGDNFGSGSSREHAPWALLDYGFRAVVSTGFADIFRNNSLKNGLLVVEVPAEVSAELFRLVEADPVLELTIDLDEQALSWTAPGDGDERLQPFDIDPFARRCLLEGVDQLGYLLERLPEIESYEERQSAG